MMHVELSRIRAVGRPGDDTSAIKAAHLKHLQGMAPTAAVLNQIQQLETELKGPTMTTGTVVRALIDKGFCFVKRDDDGTDIFLHVNDLADDVAFDETINERRLQFDVTDGKSGKKRAINARAT